MRIFLSALLATAVHSFSYHPAAHQTWGTSTALRSTVEAVGSDIVAAYESQIAKMKAKDETSKALSKEVSVSLAVKAVKPKRSKIRVSFFLHLLDAATCNQIMLHMLTKFFRLV